MKISLLIILVSFFQFASAQKQNWDKALIGSWEFEKLDVDRGNEYSGLNQFQTDGKFESLLTLVDHNGEAENYAGQGIWWTEMNYIFYKYEDGTIHSQSYEIIDENTIRIKEISPSDNPILDDLIYERAPE